LVGVSDPAKTQGRTIFHKKYASVRGKGFSLPGKAGQSTGRTGCPAAAPIWTGGRKNLSGMFQPPVERPPYAGPAPAEFESSLAPHPAHPSHPARYQRGQAYRLIPAGSSDPVGRSCPNEA